MIVYVFLIVLGFISGFCMHSLIIDGWGKTARFSQSELQHIRFEIEKIKNEDINKYKAILEEWKTLINNEKGKIKDASLALQLIIAKVKNK